LEDDMNNWIKRTAAAVGIAGAFALPMSGLASDGTIIFTGAVTASTCAIDVNGTGVDSATVKLPTVDTAALTNTAPRTTAGGTFFSIVLTGCTTAADIGGNAPTTVQIYFEAGPNVDENTGGLINTVAGSNVEVMLYNASEGSIDPGPQITPGKGGNGLDVGGVQPPVQTIANLTGVQTGTQWFYAGYSTQRPNVAATAGAVSTSVTYSLIYN
jgi:major type 1 subunit fimbrin (pilin)